MDEPSSSSCSFLDNECRCSEEERSSDESKVSQLFCDQQSEADVASSNRRKGQLKPRLRMRQSTIADDSRYFFRSLLLAVLLCCCLTSISAEQVSLLDTRNATKELKWQTFSLEKFADESSNAGWLEETFPLSSDGKNYRAYVSCDVDSDNVDNWVRTPWIQRPSEGVKRIYIEIQFTMRDCTEFPGRAVNCKETFSLHHYESDYDFAKARSPAWNTDTWGLVDRITPNVGRFSTTKEKRVLNVERQSVEVKKKGVYFALRDQGGCTSILALRIYYQMCDEKIMNLAHFPVTHTGTGKHSLVKATGSCIKNAVVGTSSPEYYCKADGKMDAFTGNCICDRGYHSNEEKTQCEACAPGRYALSPGAADCRPCPEHSDAEGTGNFECICLAGYYRADGETPHVPCTRPPEKPSLIRVIESQPTSVTIGWSEPVDKGGRDVVWYKVQCNNCPTTAQFSPGKGPLNSTHVTIRGLAPGQSYDVMVLAENHVSSKINMMPQYAVIDAKTEASAPIQVPGFRIASVGDTQVTLEWQPAVLTPTEDGNGGRNLVVDRYTVRGFLDGYSEAHGRLSQDTSDTQIKFENLLPNKEYRFEVRATTNRGHSSWSGMKVVKTTGAQRGSKDSSDRVNPWLIALIIALMLIFFLLLLVCWIACRRNRSGKKQPSDLDVLDYKNEQSLTPDYNHFHAFGTLPVNHKGPPLIHANGGTPPHRCPSDNMRPSSGFKPYVDPTLYEDPNQALSQFAPEVDPQDVTIDNIIGAGEFGEVCKGSLQLSDGSRLVVALKTLKTPAGDSSTTGRSTNNLLLIRGSSASLASHQTAGRQQGKTKQNFLLEASIMGQFDHPNVIRLIGVVTRSDPVMIVTEFMENGALDAFLRRHDGRLGIRTLVLLLRGVAAGMKYLSDMGYVHRDLAARNVLVDSHLTAKIADFGLSRETEGSEEVYTTKGGKIPVRWTAPEAITHRKFTTASDVWSFGIVAWEVASYGERPYYDWSNQEVIEAVNHQGYRLPKPMDCPVGLHALMLRCWEFERTRRPTFGEIVGVLGEFIDNPATLNEIVNFSLYSSGSPMDVTGSSLQTAGPVIAARGAPPPPLPRGPPPPSQEELLVRIGLGHCHQRLLQNGVRNLDQLLRLNVIDYLSYGIAKEEAVRIQIELQKLLGQTSATRPSYQTLPRGGTIAPPPPPPPIPNGSYPQHHMVTTLQPQRRPMPTATNGGTEGFFV